MDETKIELKSINELLECSFLIPSYQRGYRWDKRQIVELLNDIFEFIPQKAEGKEFYCLQPIIVKVKDGLFKLIDGQQRLTTIYIILSYLKKKKFSIEFETRERSKDFLQNISEEMNEDNIDFYHISNAYTFIQEWFEVKEQEEATIVDEFYICLGKYTKVIWYEIGPDEVEIDVFTRINSGKIPLTEAELIKALFLNSDNFEEEEKNLKQIEIAKEWDEMEFELQNDEFWYFLAKDKDCPTRINLLFEIFANTDSSDAITAYNFFTNIEDIVSVWSEEDENIKKIFLSLKHWFADRELYHLIGYLIATDKMNIKEIYQLFQEQRKSDFRNELYSRIKGDLDLEKIGELDYNYNYTQVFRVLLLFNIATILNNSNSYVRFAYDKFNAESWSLEHIHAQQDKGLRSDDIIRKWLKEVKHQIRKIRIENKRGEKHKAKSELTNEINELLSFEKIDSDDELFLDVQNKVFDFFGEPDVNTIDNLALLSTDVNSSLSNNIFPLKREILIAKDKMGEFIPICTKNVFLKYYSKDIDDLHFWNSNDREDYLEEIKRVLNKF